MHLNDLLNKGTKKTGVHKHHNTTTTANKTQPILCVFIYLFLLFFGCNFVLSGLTPAHWRVLKLILFDVCMPLYDNIRGHPLTHIYILCWYISEKHFPGCFFYKIRALIFPVFVCTPFGQLSHMF